MNFGLKGALEAKWIIRYANGKYSLWWKVFYAWGKSEVNRLLPALANKGNNLVLLCFVDSALGKNGRAREVVNQ